MTIRLDPEHLAHRNTPHPGISRPAATPAQIGRTLVNTNVFYVGPEQTVRQVLYVCVIRTAAIIQPSRHPVEANTYLALVVIGIHVERQTELLPVAHARNGLSANLRLGKGRQQHGGQDRDDGDNHQ